MRHMFHVLISRYVLGTRDNDIWGLSKSMGNNLDQESFLIWIYAQCVLKQQTCHTIVHDECDKFSASAHRNGMFLSCNNSLLTM